MLLSCLRQSQVWACEDNLYTMMTCAGGRLLHHAEGGSEESGASVAEVLQESPA